jgi:hypothetical protein
MNRIASVKYNFDPVNNTACLFILSPALENLYNKLGFPVREYSSREFSDLLQSYSAYLVRGVSIDNYHEFTHGEETIRIYTQKCGLSSSLRIKGSHDSEVINISCARAVGIGKGFTFQVHPLNPNRAKGLINGFCAGLHEYYKCLKNHYDLQETWKKNLDKK